MINPFVQEDSTELFNEIAELKQTRNKDPLITLRIQLLYDFLIQDYDKSIKIAVNAGYDNAILHIFRQDTIISGIPLWDYWMPTDPIIEEYYRINGSLINMISCKLYPFKIEITEKMINDVKYYILWIKT